MHRVVSALLLVVAVGCAKPWPKVEPVRMDPLVPTASEWRVVDHVIVITDASWTMNAEALFPEASAITRSIVVAMPEPDSSAKGSPDYRASLIAFGGNERLRVPHAPFERTTLLLKADEIRPLGDPPFGGSTPLADVIDEAAKSLSGQRGAAAVVIIGDGIADDDAAAIEATRSLVSGRPDPVCIHAIHSGESVEGKVVLERMVALSTNRCGSLRPASSVRDARSVEAFERQVFLDRAPLPAVSAAAVATPARCGGRIVLRGVTFDLDKASLRADSEEVLAFAAEQLRECTTRRVTVEGHTCALGENTHNLGLSERRADAVRDYLLAHGVAAEQLATRGVGEADPVASNDSADGRAQNRRVELVPVD